MLIGNNINPFSVSLVKSVADKHSVSCNSELHEYKAVDAAKIGNMLFL